MRRTPSGRMRARVDPDAMEKVTRFFNATVADTLREIFQNARRAGASAIEVKRGEGWVVVSDDGCGIADPEELLAFGRSGWQEARTRREHPAGMGLYALASWPRTRVRSRARPDRFPGDADTRPWEAELRTEHFTGQEDAAIYTPETETAFGTTAAFEAQADFEEVKKAARYLPVPVTCDGQRITQEDFLAAADHVETFRGVRIGVERGSRTIDDKDGAINFHGVQVRLAEGPQRSRLALVRTLDETWWARGDVSDCPPLRIVLPGREEVVENWFTKDLRRAAEKAIYEEIAASDRGGIPFSVHQQAASRGVELPVPEAKLTPWQPTYADEYSPYEEAPRPARVDTDAVIVDIEAPAPQTQALYRAIAADKDRLFERESAYEGYPWYDALPVVDQLLTEVVRNDEKTTVEREIAAGRCVKSGRAKSIRMLLLNGGREVAVYEADVAFGNRCDDEPSYTEPIVTRISECTVQELSELMFNAMFNPAENKWTKNHCWERCNEVARNVLLDPKTALCETVRAAVGQRLENLVPDGTTATIVVVGGESTRVSISDGEA